MSDFIVGLRLRLIALIRLFLTTLFFLFSTFTLKICAGVFSGSVEARILEVGIHMDDEL